DALRPLRLNGTLRSVMHIGNDYKVVGASSQLHATGRWDDGPPDEAAMAERRRSMKIGSWTGPAGRCGPRAQVREARRLGKRALAGKVTRLQFVDDRLLAFMN